MNGPNRLDRPDRELRDAVEALAAERDPGNHLDPEELAAYHAGELAPEEESRVQDHLVHCRECSELLLDLEGLGDPGFGREEDLPPNAGETVWEGVRERIRREAPPRQAAQVVPLEPRRARPAGSPRGWQALAASLLIATVGLSFWVGSLRRTVGELSRPQVNAPVLDLYPEGRMRRGGAAGTPEVPPEARLFTLILSPPGTSTFHEYRVEVLREGGGTVWAERGLRRNSFGSLSLTLPRHALGAGDFRIRLFGVVPGGPRQEEPIEEYALRITTP